MNIALVGYGNMGKELERLVAERPEHTIVSISCTQSHQALDHQGIKSADVAIDFTSPEIVFSNIQEIMSLGTPLVVGTTGWYSQISDVERMVATADTALIYGQNFSVGANIFFQLVRTASKLTYPFRDYDVFGIETHHNGKKDSPSGTARKLGEIILENFPRKKVVNDGKVERQIKPHELHFASVRGGRNFGRHEVIFDSPADEIRLTHQAWSRRGFAEGALIAAEFIYDKKGFFQFEELFMKGEFGR